nr:shikimate kinase [Desulfuromonas thiophila]
MMASDLGNLTLIGMPGAGKSTLGVVLAKRLSLGFVDTDVLIQVNRGKALQQILDEAGYLELRRIEEEEILRLQVERHVIATGGSAVYSAAAMAHLQRLSTIVFLDVAFDEICRRIHNFDSRGIACAPGQSFAELYQERLLLYRRYAEITIDANRGGQEELAERIADQLLA